MLIFAFPLRAIPSPRAEPGLLQVPPVQLMVLEDLQPFPNFHLCLTLPIPNNTMEHGPRLPQGIITWVLVFKGFLQHSWLHFCVWLQCVCSGRGASPGAEAVQAGLQSSSSQTVFVSHFHVCQGGKQTWGVLAASKACSGGVGLPGPVQPSLMLPLCVCRS